MPADDGCRNKSHIAPRFGVRLPGSDTWCNDGRSALKMPNAMETCQPPDITSITSSTDETSREFDLAGLDGGTVSRVMVTLAANLLWT